MNKMMMVSISLAAVFSCSINALATDLVPNPEEIIEQTVPAESGMYTAPNQDVATDAVPVTTPTEPAPEPVPEPAPGPVPEAVPEPSAPDPEIIVPAN